MPHDLRSHPVHLGLGATVVPQPAFAGMPWYEEYAHRTAADGAEGRLVSLYDFAESWDSWEMHPTGDELVVCLAGEITLIQERPDGSFHSETLGAGQYAVNPPGTWHTADVTSQATTLFVTAGAGHPASSALSLRGHEPAAPSVTNDHTLRARRHNCATIRLYHGQQKVVRREPFPCALRLSQFLSKAGLEMTMKTFAIGLSMAALVLGGSAFAAQGGVKADADGNGVVTRAEAQTKAAGMFARLDANKDGKLDKTDREARVAARKTRMFERLDADKNGQITKTEFMADKGAGEGQHRMGRRGQGGRMAMNGAEHGGRGQAARHGGRRGGGMMGARMADSNSDGAVSQAEFASAALKRFDTTDANKDGQVTKEERQAAREQMKAKWQQMRAQKAQG